VHQADPEFRTLVTTTVWDAEAHGVLDGIDILVPVVNWIDDRPGTADAGDQRPRYDGFLASAPDKELWLYQSCMSHGCGGTVDIGNPSEADRSHTGWPSYMIDASAVRNRAMEWLSFLYDATGELYWETAFAYTKDAWRSQFDFSGNGDGTLFYPGTPARIGGQTHIPVASIRLKMIREGMEDYEYLRLLAAAGGEAQAREIARALFPHPYESDAAPEAVMSAREDLAVRILAATGRSAGAVGGGDGAGGVAPGGDGAGGIAPGGGDGAAGVAPGGKASQPVVAGDAGDGGGCGSSGGSGAGAVLAVPALLALVGRRRRTEA
jgi:uncharacterized protein (TIGR03382 family)